MVRLIPIDSRRVTLRVRNGKPMYKIHPRREGLGFTAFIDTNNEPTEVLEHPDIIHFKGKTQDSEGWEGDSILKHASKTLAITNEHFRHARESLDGGNMTGYLYSDEPLTDAQFNS